VYYVPSLRPLSLSGALPHRLHRVLPRVLVVLDRCSSINTRGLVAIVLILAVNASLVSCFLYVVSEEGLLLKSSKQDVVVCDSGSLTGLRVPIGAKRLEVIAA
jgi:hypothetical protein